MYKKSISPCKCGAVPRMTSILLQYDYNAEGDLVFYPVYCPACGEGHDCSKDRYNYHHPEKGSYEKPDAVRYWNNTIAGRSKFDDDDGVAIEGKEERSRTKPPLTVNARDEPTTKLLWVNKPIFRRVIKRRGGGFNGN